MKIDSVVVKGCGPWEIASVAVPGPEVQFLALYDGERSYVQFCKKYFHCEIQKLYGSGADLGDSLRAAFESFDALMRTRKGQKELARLIEENAGEFTEVWDAQDREDIVDHENTRAGGCMTMVCLIFPEKVVVANAGDFRCIVLKSCGEVVEIGDCCSSKETSNGPKGLGHFLFKQSPSGASGNLITAAPDVHEVSTKSGIDLIAFASKEIWACNPIFNREMVNFITACGSRSLHDACVDFLEAWLHFVQMKRPDAAFGNLGMATVLLNSSCITSSPLKPVLAGISLAASHHLEEEVCALNPVERVPKDKPRAKTLCIVPVFFRRCLCLDRFSSPATGLGSNPVVLAVTSMLAIAALVYSRVKKN